MNFDTLRLLFADKGCSEIYAKTLSTNDNSKNQIYFSGNFDILNILPLKEIKTVEAGDWSKERFVAKINYSWIDNAGNLFPAPKSKLILYPKYPEVRFSGFLQGCQKAPSDLMTKGKSADEGRILFIGVTKLGSVIGYVAAHNSFLAKEFKNIDQSYKYGVFDVIELPQIQNNKIILLNELLRIHQLDWIESKRLDKNGNILPCKATNCGGYTLEAELGITPNGYSEPDFMGWEIKQFGVRKFHLLNSSVITLMTPEPTGGLYKSNGTEYFIRNYGYPDRKGRIDRMNFGGVHKCGNRHHLTNLELKLIGFDASSGKIRNTNGRIALIDFTGKEAASWSFSSLLLHWNRKHNKACYLPSLSITTGNRKYKYGSSVILGENTDFQLFLSQMDLGNVYYDPGIKLENMSTKPKIKKRSQFRIKSKFLPELYKINEIVDLLKL